MFVFFMMVLIIIVMPRILASLDNGGKTVMKEVTYTSPNGYVYDLFENILRQPHTLIAGATGSGKSVVMNGLIDTIMHKLPFDRSGGAQMILIDPKRVELADYKALPHTLLHAGGQNPEAWSNALNKAVKIMDERYNRMEQNRQKEYIGGDVYVFIDEWASINSKHNPLRTACVASLLRLVSEGRAAHVHVILATQVPKATVIPTEVRDNFVARLALMTENKLQSRVIIDTDGCEQFPSPKHVGYALGMYCLPGNDRTVYEMPYVKQNQIDQDLAWWAEQKRMNGLK